MPTWLANSCNTLISVLQPLTNTERKLPCTERVAGKQRGRGDGNRRLLYPPTLAVTLQMWHRYRNDPYVLFLANSHELSKGSWEGNVGKQKGRSVP